MIEDRVLFQLPPFTMKPGKYEVYVGLYRKSTGERIKILNGGGDGTGRVMIGSFEVKRLQPLIHQLIPPTRVEIMRKYPDRIIDAHKHPGLGFDLTRRRVGRRPSRARSSWRTFSALNFAARSRIVVEDLLGRRELALDPAQRVDARDDERRADTG